MNKISRTIIILLCIAAVTLAPIACYLTFVNRGYTLVSFLNVGQGDSCYIKTERGNSVLIDGGESDISRFVFKDIFRLNFVTELEAVFVSHIHADHTGGIIELLDERFPIGVIYISKNARKDSLQYKRLKSAADACNVKIESLSAGDKINLDGLTFSVIAAGRTDGEQTNENENSLVLRMDYGSNSFLFTGDAGAGLEGDILSDRAVDTDFLKVAHHGSSSSSCSEFINAVSPELAIISVGSHNDYLHPSSLVLDSFKESGIPVVRTDINGTICITMTPDDIKDINPQRSDF